MSRPAPLHVDGFTANNAHLYDQYALVPQGLSADLIATTGGMLIGTLLDELERRDLQTGLGPCAPVAAWAPPPSSSPRVR